MPIYEFECQGCGRIAEHLITNGITTGFECGKCGAPMKKIMSAPAPPDVKGFNAKNRYSHEKKDREKKKE